MTLQTTAKTRTKAFLNEAFYIAGQAGICPLALGAPGLAKTSSCESLADAAGRYFAEYILSREAPEDIGGYPSPNFDAGYVRKMPDYRLWRCSQEPSVLLFDELTTTPTSLQGPALEVIRKPPGEDTWVFACGNPETSCTDYHPLAPPTINRLCILQWEFDQKTYLDGLRSFSWDSPQVPLIPQWWFEGRKSRTRDHWGELVNTYLTRNPGEILKENLDVTKSQDPWASPRSWGNAGLLCSAAAACDSPPDVLVQLVNGCVGQAAQTGFSAFLRDCELPDPEEVLCNPGLLARIMPKMPRDLHLVVGRALVDAVRRDQTVDRYKALRACHAVYAEINGELGEILGGAVWDLKPAGYLDEEYASFTTKKGKKAATAK